MSSCHDSGPPWEMRSLGVLEMQSPEPPPTSVPSSSCTFLGIPAADSAIVDKGAEHAWALSATGPAGFCQTTSCFQQIIVLKADIVLTSCLTIC